VELEEEVESRRAAVEAVEASPLPLPPLFSSAVGCSCSGFGDENEDEERLRCWTWCFVNSGGTSGSTGSGSGRQSRKLGEAQSVEGEEGSMQSVLKGLGASAPRAGVARRFGVSRQKSSPGLRQGFGVRSPTGVLEP